jgi:RES domain-containing protein
LRIWRIAKPEFAPSLDGKGAALAGGRWNDVGNPAVYTAESVSLAALETFVNLTQNARLAQNLPTLILVGLDVSDHSFEHAPDLSADGSASRRFGTVWLQSRRTFGLIVQSHVVPFDKNIVLNPLHPAMATLAPMVSQTFAFDSLMGI